MPVLDGIEATKKLRQFEKKRNYICAFAVDTDQEGLNDKNLFDAVLHKKNAPQLLKSIKSMMSTIN